jgi:hypothetical protein
MFRASTMAFGAAVVIVALGLLTFVFVADGSVLAGGLLLAAVSGLLGYKVTISTMSLIDADPTLVGAHGIDVR